MAKRPKIYQVIESALSAYVHNSSVKVRDRGLLVGRREVFLHTSHFEVVHEFKSSAYVIKINPPTNLNQDLLKYAIQCIKRIYVPGFPYQKICVFTTQFSKEEPG